MNHPMEDRLRQLKDRADTIRMTTDEKAAIRSRLSAFMTMRPVRSDVVERHGKAETKILNLSPKLMPFFAVFLSLLLAGGGVSYAAEGSLPGDVLYPVKVHVNEEVRAALAIDDEAKAEWETSRAERRINEARVLLEADTATSEQIDDLEARFAEHEGRVEATIARIEEKKGPEFAARVSSHLETSLVAHQAILDRLSVKEEVDADAEVDTSHEAQDGSSSEERAGRFAEKVGEARERATEMREHAESRARDEDSDGPYVDVDADIDIQVDDDEDHQEDDQEGFLRAEIHL